MEVLTEIQPLCMSVCFHCPSPNKSLLFQISKPVDFRVPKMDEAWASCSIVTSSFSIHTSINNTLHASTTTSEKILTFPQTETSHVLNLIQNETYRLSFIILHVLFSIHLTLHACLCVPCVLLCIFNALHKPRKTSLTRPLPRPWSCSWTAAGLTPHKHWRNMALRRLVEQLSRRKPGQLCDSVTRCPESLTTMRCSLTRLSR